MRSEEDQRYEFWRYEDSKTNIGFTFFCLLNSSLLDCLSLIFTQQNYIELWKHTGLPRLLSGQETACNAGDADSIPGWGRSLGNPLQCFCLENPMNWGAWWATVHRVSKRHDWSNLARTHAWEYIYMYVTSVLLDFNWVRKGVCSFIQSQVWN